MMKLLKQRFLNLVERSGLTVTDVAAAIGCSDGHLYNAIAGRKGLGLKYSKRLIEMFGVDRMQFAIDWNSMGISDPLREAR